MDTNTVLSAYIKELSEKILKTDVSHLELVCNSLIEAKQEKRQIFIIGNGGSASTASHMANDLVKGCRIGDCTGLRAIALTDSNAIITCLANDFSYEEIYSIQIKTYAEPGDLLIGFSGSGNSKNVLRGLDIAKQMGLKTIGFTGATGGNMEQYCDILVHAPTDCMEMLEDLHLMYEHTLVMAVRQELQKLC